MQDRFHQHIPHFAGRVLLLDFYFEYGAGSTHAKANRLNQNPVTREATRGYGFEV